MLGDYLFPEDMPGYIGAAYNFSVEGNFDTAKISSENKSYDYYVVGHSLGGRLAQDVLYKLYNANEGGIFKKKANIQTPVHSATFNGLGYNNIIYATLERDVLSGYKMILTNFYYWKDIVYK